MSSAVDRLKRRGELAKSVESKTVIASVNVDIPPVKETTLKHEEINVKEKAALGHRFKAKEEKIVPEKKYTGKSLYTSIDISEKTVSQLDILRSKQKIKTRMGIIKFLTKYSKK